MTSEPIAETNRPLIVGPEKCQKPFPLFLEGTVMKGFGRGGKELGVPTANLPQEVANEKCEAYENGIYFGWAIVPSADGTVHPMVMSIGWNPFYKNVHRSAEVHIIHNFDGDFYGEQLRVIVLGYIRPELDYSCVEDLIKDINIDIMVAKNSLNRPSYRAWANDEFLIQSNCT